MEKLKNLNIHFDNLENIIKSICWILSYITWLLLTINSWVSLRWLYNKKYLKIWTINIIVDISKHVYIPLQMYYILIYAIFNISNVIILSGCVYFFIATLIKKDNQFIVKIMENPSKFHFFPLLIAFFMFILGESPKNSQNDLKSVNGGGLALSLIGLGSMIFLYIMTNLSEINWMANYFIKKGTYSCLIILFWYNFCYSIYQVHITNKPDDKNIIKWMKGCGMAFSIIFGLCALGFSFYFKDILICFMNFLIYIGLAIYCSIHNTIHFNEKHILAKFYNKEKKGDLIVDMIMISLSFFLLIFLIIYNFKNFIEEFKSEIENVKNGHEKIKLKVNNNIEEIEMIKCNINLTPMETKTNYEK